MDQATRHRIATEQLGRLSALVQAVRPAGVVEHPTLADEVAGVRTKYLAHIDHDLQTLFPAYRQHRRPSPRLLAALGDELPYQGDCYRNLDALFEALLADVQGLTRADAWHDLLLIERAIAKTKIAPCVDEPRERVARRLRALKPRRERSLERDGVCFVWLTTDLISEFGYPGRDPRRARPLERTTCAAIYRRSRPATLETQWLE